MLPRKLQNSFLDLPGAPRSPLLRQNPSCVSTGGNATAGHSSGPASRRPPEPTSINIYSSEEDYCVSSAVVSTPSEIARR